MKPIWTPADFDATAAAAALQPKVVLPLQNRAHLLDKVMTELGIEVELQPVMVRGKRGRRYRGQHRANKFRLTVADLLGGAAR